jgi:predicted ATPase
MRPDERMDVSGVDPRIVALTQSVSISVNQGRLAQADQGTREAVRIAEARDHAPSRSWAMSLARWMAFRHGDMEESIRLSQQLLELADRMGFKTRLGSGRLLMGRAVVAAGQVEAGTRLLQEGYAMWAALGAKAGATELASIAADALIDAGQMDAAEPFVRAGEKAQADTAERIFAAELARQRGRLWQAAGGAYAADAEAGYRQAITIARSQGARLFTLRAATDLALLLHGQGRVDEADAMLRPALDAMPEGLDQRDARRAQATLQALLAGAPAGP